MEQEAYGKRIYRLRRAKRWSVLDLAKKTGLTEPTIRRLEAGEPSTTRTLRKLAAALDVEADYFLEKLEKNE